MPTDPQESNKYIYILEIYLDSGPIFVATDDIILEQDEFRTITDNV